ncbi:TetR/AcrR family transcriptional regulator [Bacillus subtilis]|nr:TetR/AcrR family transcriptional regulator [Bacillus subtilis]WGP06837.1 TetR/AcrR family transcriptional regulator [Bacillus subtilis]WGP07747.1 TetR/AcrR family transcriptional regulator [Bacillus subtilis]
MRPTRPGRPPQFDRTQAILESARLFWRQGYGGTSTRELSAALGMSTSSIYAAFGSKAGLFEEAIRTYSGRYRRIYEDACGETSFDLTMTVLFIRSVEEFTQPSDEHPGCLISSAAMTDGPETFDLRSYIGDLHAGNHRLLLDRTQRAQLENQVDENLDAATFASTVQTVWHGLSAQSNLGAGREDLLGIARLFVAKLPIQSMPITL